MDLTEMEQLLRNVDQRLAHVEQFLPTLATKAELAEVRTEIRTEARETRRHFDVVAESLRDDIRLLADGLVGVTQRPDRM
ncbi:MAG: hypothetical protein QGG24_03990 [Vicinamibacterales bacterium]|nr:hypothetical protein [Vicinamibacterales bacterium]MDP7478308.1 hypothetical protein [Vicinamibacterales bacterium]MDP7672304.1 hypothetical protein [Vicinamibacterales bacterium]HJO37933.1 hypothetical protein [Vicinamibacterales bacterium]